MYVHRLISWLDLESTKATIRLKRIGAILPGILTEKVLMETILTYFSKYC